jgi:hypothetical protein
MQVEAKSSRLYKNRDACTRCFVLGHYSGQVVTIPEIKLMSIILT